MARETATLAGGCFWCVEAVFNALQGVECVQSGYMGGQTANPTYEAVCTGRTGHAEVVHIAFDPDVISFREILEVFFTTHDPTTLNRQGADAGTQYRSAIFYHTAEQAETAQQVIAAFDTEQIWPNAIVTEVTPVSTFYAAEDYHQSYYANNPEQPYCNAVIPPKLAKLRQKFAEKLKE